jgi:hypothetical protein
VSSSGALQIDGGNVNPISTTYQTATQACATLLPTGTTLPATPQPPRPKTPSLNFTCQGDCPTPPEPPTPPQ